MGQKDGYGREPEPDLGAELKAFALERARKTGNPCWVCTLPKEIRDEIEKNAGNISARVIVEWLREKRGLSEASISRVSGHLRNHVRRMA